jgi:hypothetical protein
MPKTARPTGKAGRNSTEKRSKGGKQSRISVPKRRPASSTRPTLPPENGALLSAHRIVSADELVTRELPPPNLIVDELLPVGLTIFAGRAKVGKSWMALQLATAVASGQPFLGREVQRGNVLIIALEDSDRRTQERLKQLGWSQAEGHALLHIRTQSQVGLLETPMNDAGRSELASLVREYSYKLVIVDTLTRAVRGDPNGQRDMTARLAPLQEMAQALEFALQLVDHHGKKVGEARLLDDVAGSHAKGAVADAIWGLYRPGVDPTAKLLTTGRDIRDQVLPIKFDTETGTWQSLGRQEPILAEPLRKIVAALKAANGRPLRQGDVARSLKIDKGNASRWFGELKTTGVIQGDRTGYTLTSKG